MDSYNDISRIPRCVRSLILLFSFLGDLAELQNWLGSQPPRIWQECRGTPIRCVCPLEIPRVGIHSGWVPPVSSATHRATLFDLHHRWAMGLATIALISTSA